MARQNKKERQRLKRKRKQMQLRKERNASIFKKLAQVDAPIRCYINAEWRDEGMAEILALRDVPGGGRILAAYLIDAWCIGLKDVFGRMNVTLEDFEEHLAHADSRGLKMAPIDPAMARGLVAAAMRLSAQNGFHLPHRADRWACVVGVRSYANADLSLFEKPGGKYRYVGSMQDLRKRLIGSVDDFLSRSDIEFVISEGPGGDWGPVDDLDEDFEDEQDEEVDNSGPPPEFVQMINDIADRGLRAVRKWLVENGRTPHPRLRDGFDLVLMASFLGMAPGGENSTLLSERFERDEDPDALMAAAEQVHEFIKQFDTPQRFLEAMGFDGDAGDQDEAATLLLPPS
jgi:hypothetical protein